MIRFGSIGRRAGAALALALALALSASAGCAKRRAEPPIPPEFNGLLVRQPLPKLALREWLVGPNPLRPEFGRRPCLILFWNYGDPASGQAIALVDSIGRAVPQDRLAVFTIHTEVGLEESQSRAGLQKFVVAQRLMLPVAIDRGNESLRLCQLPDVPSLVFVDANRTVRGAMENYRQSRNGDIAAFVERLAGER